MRISVCLRRRVQVFGFVLARCSMRQLGFALTGARENINDETLGIHRNHYGEEAERAKGEDRLKLPLPLASCLAPAGFVGTSQYRFVRNADFVLCIAA